MTQPSKQAMEGSVAAIGRLGFTKCIEKKSPMPERFVARHAECECGDYDVNHEARTGYCHFNVPPKDRPLATTDMCHGMRNCLRFRPVAIRRSMLHPETTR